METENNTPTLGSNATITKINTEPTSIEGFLMFLVYIEFYGHEFMAQVHEADTFDDRSTFSVTSSDEGHDYLRSGLADMLNDYWPELVSICKHERTRRRRENETI